MKEFEDDDIPDKGLLSDTKSKGKPSDKKVIVKKDTLVRKWSSHVGKSYLFLKRLGQGSFGQVFLVQHKQLKVLRALKSVKKFEKPHANAADQLQLLKKLDHPNILKIYEYFQTKEKWYIITEYFEGKQLFDQIVDENRLSEQICSQIIYQILKALNYIHSNKIAHRDIKAQNVLVRESGGYYEVKLIDWGLGAISQGYAMNRRCGTPQYCAPEILSGEYTLSCDMWSLGVLSYVILSGYMPFKGKDMKDTLARAKTGHIDFSLQIWQERSHLSKDFIRRLIEKNPEKRMTAEDSLSHDWITKYSKKSFSSFDDEQNLAQTLKRIKDFQTQNKFQVLTINYIINFIQTPKQLQRLKKQFEMLDLNNDGQISYEELLFAYRGIYGPQADLIVENIFTNIDLDQSGAITFSQFITFASQITNNFSQEQLKEAFKLFDADNDGLIDKKQISGLIQYEKSSRSTSEEFDEIINEIDLNNDGKIDFQEFIEHINKAVEKVKTRTNQSLKQSEQKMRWSLNQTQILNSPTMKESQASNTVFALSRKKQEE